jgi:PAS domain S-box-containing protein
MASVLIVEDEIILAKDLSHSLIGMGYENAGIASSGEEALSLIEIKAPDIILMDINLAGDLDGIETAQIIRSQWDIPILYLTAYSENNIVERAKKTEPYGYLGKPVSLAELRSGLETALYKHEADQRRRAGEARMARAEELANLHSWEWEIHSGKVAWSQNSYRAFGLDPDEVELNYQTFLNLIHNDDRERVLRVLDKALKGLAPYDIEFRIVRPNGEERYLHSKGAVIRDSQGEPVKMQGMALDITDRKKAEEALLKSESKYRLLAENTLDIIWRMDLDLNFTYVNPAISKVTGHTVEEFIGTNLKDHCDEGNFRKFVRVVADEISKGVDSPGIVLEAQVFNNKGRPIDVEIHGKVIVDEVGTPVCLQGVTRDIARRKEAERAEEKILQSEERFRSLLDQAADEIYVHDYDGRFLDVNKQACLSLGYTRDELLGMSVTDVDPDAQIRDDKGKFWSNLPITFEARHKKKDGSTHPVEMRLGHIEYENERLILAIARDITDRKIAEQTILRSLAEKEALLREIHHRVKNNLATISSLLHLQSQFAGDHFHEGLFKECQERVRSMCLVHELLYGSDNLKEIISSEYIEGLVKQLESGCAVIGREISVVTEIEEVPLTSQFAVPLGFIVTELVSNCYKHAFKERNTGEIRLELFRQEDGKIVLVVADNGVGLPENLKIKDSKTLGMGLVETFADQLGAHVEILRKQGTEFRVVFKDR